MRRSFYRLLFGLMSVAAVAIALLFGGGVYLYEVERIDDAVVESAMREAGDFARLRPDVVGDDAAAVEAALQRFLAAREQGADGHFVFAEIYDKQRRGLGEASLGDVGEVEAAFDRNAHPFPRDGLAHYDKATVGGKLYLRVLTALRTPTFEGFFEGVFQVAPARLERIRENVLATALIVVGVVIGATLFLSPVVIGLNRHQIALSEKLLRANLEILEVLGGAVAKRDSDTGVHNYRVTLYAVRLAEELGRSAEEMRALIKGAFLHDVGKIAVSDAILLKPGKLTAEEFEIMKTHVAHGIDIVSRSPWLDDARPVVAGHHEKYDGGGYPLGLKGEAIPAGARIFAVVDVFDALTSRRPYKAAMPFAQAMTILEEGRGRHFDPAALDAFARIAPDLYHRFSALTDTEEAGLREMLLETTRKYF
jgi:HD-GYP domain-containing protein (c-di-GMP phosphodiesterase class II)